MNSTLIAALIGVRGRTMPDDSPCFCFDHLMRGGRHEDQCNRARSAAGYSTAFVLRYANGDISSRFHLSAAKLRAKAARETVTIERARP